MADEASSDPFDVLIRDVASPEGPTNTDASAPPAGDAGASAPKAEGGATPGAQDQSTAKPAPLAPDQGKPAGTENPTDPAQAEAGKGSLPEYLKPFEPTLKAKGWDLSKPEGVAKVLQSFQEAESTLGRRQSDVNLLMTRQQEIEKDFQTGPDGVNRRLELMGLSKLDIPTPESRHKELKEIWSAISVAVHPNATEEQRAKAFENLDRLVYDQMDNLRIRLAAGQGQAQSAKAKLGEYRTNSANLFNQRVGANPEISKAYDALLPAFQPGGVFHSFGLDEFAMTSSPERAQAIEQLGQAVAWKQASYNPDGSVKEGGPVDVEIKKALALVNRNGAAAPAGNGQPPAPQANGQQQDPLDAMLSNWAREAAMA